jgi:anti-anti-sigma factor
MSLPEDGQVMYARRGDTWVLRFVGPVRYTAAHALDRFIDDVLEHEKPAAIHIDLNAATSIDSTGIGVIAKIANAVDPPGKPVIFSSNPEINEVLTNLCIDEVCTIVEGGIDEPVDSAIPATTPTERELAGTVLQAHRLLCELSEDNRAAFKDVVDALKHDLGES